jgi:hypothetical protein
MRYEFERDGTVIARVLWEGPGQVQVESADLTLRPELERWFASEVTYMEGGFGFGPEEAEDREEDVLQTRRRDWTPWEFERACRNIAHRWGCAVRRVETGPVEDRPQGVGAR